MNCKKLLRKLRDAEASLYMSSQACDLAASDNTTTTPLKEVEVWYKHSLETWQKLVTKVEAKPSTKCIEARKFIEESIPTF